MLIKGFRININVLVARIYSFYHPQQSTNTWWRNSYSFIHFHTRFPLRRVAGSGNRNTSRSTAISSNSADWPRTETWPNEVGDAVTLPDLYTTSGSFLSLSHGFSKHDLPRSSFQGHSVHMVESMQLQSPQRRRSSGMAGREVNELRAMEAYKKQINRYQLCLFLFSNNVDFKNNNINYRKPFSNFWVRE